MPTAIVSVTNDITTDQRVHRTCMLLIERGFSVMVVGRRRKNSEEIARPYATKRFRLLFNKKFPFYAEYNLRLFFYLLFKKSDLLWSNDLDTLVANYLVAGIRRKRLVYDSHEYFCHVPELTRRPAVQRVWLWMERRIFPRLKHVITVTDSIADCYASEYGKRPLVVRNVTMRSRAKKATERLPSRKELGLPEGKKIVIMQGAGINIHRGAEEAILAMKYLDDVHLLFLGSGDAWELLKQLTIKEGLTGKVTFIPRQDYERMLQFTALADLGLSLDKPTNPNYLFSLPNKIFDYIHAGIPVLASALPEVQRIIQNYGTGEIITSHEPERIAEKISEMVNDQHQMKVWRENILKAQEILSWENESTKLHSLIDQVCKKS